MYYNDTLNQNITQVYTVNTSNCGTCTTAASSNFATCNLTANNLQADAPVCNVTVMIQIIECGIVITEKYSADLNGELYHELKLILIHALLELLQILLMLQVCTIIQ